MPGKIKLRTYTFTYDFRIQFELHFDADFDGRCKTVVGVEILIKLPDPILGAASPDQNLHPVPALRGGNNN